MPFQYNIVPFPTRSTSQTVLKKKRTLQIFEIKKLLKAKLDNPTRYVCCTKCMFGSAVRKFDFVKLILTRIELKVK